MAITVSILQKNFLMMCFTLKLPQGEVHDFSGEVQKLLGEVQNDRKGGAK